MSVEQALSYSGLPESEERLVLTPVDKLTNLPLPIFVTGEDFRDHRHDYHHHFHPKRSSALGYDENGKKLPKGAPERLEGYALRFSRGQDVPTWLHDRYHDLFYGPPLPITTTEKFKTVVLACAGVVPRAALNLYNIDAYSIKNLDTKQHDFIRRRVYHEGAASAATSSKKNHIGNFLAEYTLKNSVDEVINAKEVHDAVDRFLKPRTEQQKFDAARFILTHAIEAAVSELVPLLEEAKQEGMVRHRRRGLGAVVLKYFTVSRIPDYYAPLEDRLVRVV